jgi:hypothetical protein
MPEVSFQSVGDVQPAGEHAVGDDPVKPVGAAGDPRDGAVVGELRGLDVPQADRGSQLLDRGVDPERGGFRGLRKRENEERKDDSQALHVDFSPGPTDGHPGR